MPSLASLLTRDAVVSVELIERALERQTLEGGELDTALLELNAVPENVLAAYRAALYRSEPVGRGELLRVESAVIDCVTGKHAQRFHVIPVAMQEGMLVVASATPLTDEARTTLEAAAASPISVRITTEARIVSALERYYGVSIPERMRKLCAELDARSPGVLVYVELDKPSKPHKPNKRSTAPPATGLNTNAPHGRTQQRMSASPGLPGDAPVHVTRVVELGSELRAEQAKRADHAADAATAQTAPQADPRDKDDPFDTRPARPSKLPGARNSQRPPAASPAREDETGRTSIADIALVRALGKAQDRVAVEDTLLTHAAKHFECTVLFEVRDKFLMGRSGVGLARGIDVASLESAMSRSLQAIVLAGKPRVLDLYRDCPGDTLVSLLDRSTAQPCAVLPVSLGKRVVIALYADRGGKPLTSGDIAELCAALPSAGIALERILQERKFGALEARRSVPPHLGSRSNPPVPSQYPERTSPSVFPPGTTHITDTGLHPPRSYGQTVAGLGARESAPLENPRDISPELSEAALRSLTPPKSRPPGPYDAASEHNLGYPPPLAPSERPGGFAESGDVSPTMVLPRSSRSRPPEREADGVIDRESTRPQRPSSLPPRDGAARLIAQPHKGAGSYALRHADESVVDVTRSKSMPERGSVFPEPRRSGSPQSNPSARNEGPSDTRKEIRPSDPRRDARAADPRREAGDSMYRTDIVTMAPAIRESLRPPAPPDETEALNIDLSGEADRLVERLSASTPGEEVPLVAGLVRLGHAGIAALVRRFPGPAWAPRGQLHKRAIAGRDLGPLPRALWAFEDGIVPALTELLEAPHADARLYAAVLAGDRVHPDLLWPLYRRLFDPEGTVRLLVAETLPLYRNVQGFDDILRSLRKRAVDDRETVLHRLAALEALASLRDSDSIDVLADLAAHSDRQYSMPAQRALIAITGQDFGDAAKKWRAWYAKNAPLHRAQWLIESLLHNEQRVRSVAGNELQKLTQVYYGFVASAPKRDRERARDRYRAWWESEGKSQFAR